MKEIIEMFYGEELNELKSMSKAAKLSYVYIAASVLAVLTAACTDSVVLAVGAIANLALAVRCAKFD